MAKKRKDYYLFSVDTEDVRDQIGDGWKYAERVPKMVRVYLDFLGEYKAKATFFVVGSIARKYPSLIHEIIAEGHEVGGHGNEHIPIDHSGKEKFEEDIKKNIECLNNCGVEHVLGYRAPIFSLTEKTRWAYEVLEKLGFRYSSSVLPCRNPLYGWPEFNAEPQKINNMWELPMSVCSIKYLKVPYSGGVYFRTLPFWLALYLHKNSFKKQKAVLSYFHPYDIDVGQEKFRHPNIPDSRIFNYLMYYRRSSVLKKVAKVIEKTNCNIIPYIDFVNEIENKNSVEKRNIRL